MRAYHTVLCYLYVQFIGLHDGKVIPRTAGTLRKTSNERLRVTAARIGSVRDEEIAAMDRAALLQIVAAGSTARAEGEKDFVIQMAACQQA